jgi:hypothetical protein
MILLVLCCILTISYGFQFIHPTKDEGPFLVGSSLSVWFDIGKVPGEYVSIDYQNEIIYPGPDCTRKGDGIFCLVSVKPPIAGSIGKITAKESSARAFSTSVTFGVIYAGNKVNNYQSFLHIEQLNIINIWE